MCPIYICMSRIENVTRYVPEFSRFYPAEYAHPWDFIWDVTRAFNASSRNGGKRAHEVSRTLQRCKDAMSAHEAELIVLELVRGLR